MPKKPSFKDKLAREVFDLTAHTLGHAKDSHIRGPIQKARNKEQLERRKNKRRASDRKKK
jgi:hypothetical protein